MEHKAKSVETKEKIEEAFLSLYIDHNIDKITIKMLTDSAKMNRSTFYVYFSDIYDLLDHVQNDLFTKLETLMLPGVPRIIRGESLLEILPGVEFFVENKLKFEVLIATYGKSDLPERLKALLRKIFFEVSGESVFAGNPAASYALEYIINGQLGTFIKWFNNDFDVEFDEFKQIMNVAMNEGPLTYLKSILKM